MKKSKFAILVFNSTWNYKFRFGFVSTSRYLSKKVGHKICCQNSYNGGKSNYTIWRMKDKEIKVELMESPIFNYVWMFNLHDEDDSSCERIWNSTWHFLLKMYEDICFWGNTTKFLTVNVAKWLGLVELCN